jgi:hypothetical protein
MVDDINEEKPMTLSREDLYELAWTKPLSELAIDFKISDVALGKRCKRLGIPVPGRGYWARLDAGQKPYRPKLPKREPQWHDEGALTVAPSPEAPHVERSSPEDARSDGAWLAERLAFEDRPDSTIQVPEVTHCWDPEARKIAADLTEAAKELRASRKASDAFDKWPESRQQRESCHDAWKWRWVKDRGQRINDTHKSIAFRVSLDTYERALRITNALALAARERGFTIRDDKEIGRVVFAGHGGEVHMRLTEQLDVRTRSRVSYDGKTEPENYNVPTGRLRISLQIGYGEGPAFEDKGSNKLESMLNRVFAAIYRLVIKSRQKERQRLTFKRELEEAEHRRAAAKHIREEQERCAADERRRRDALLAEAARWNQAHLLRNYVAHIRAAAGPDSSRSTTTTWAGWALLVASDLDPTPSRLTNSVAGEKPAHPEPAASAALYSPGAIVLGR